VPPWNIWYIGRTTRDWGRRLNLFLTRRRLVVLQGLNFQGRYRRSWGDTKELWVANQIGQRPLAKLNLCHGTGNVVAMCLSIRAIVIGLRIGSPVRNNRFFLPQGTAPSSPWTRALSISTPSLKIPPFVFVYHLFFLGESKVLFPPLLRQGHQASSTLHVGFDDHEEGRWHPPSNAKWLFVQTLDRPANLHCRRIVRHF
jgi:hypothetical protein